MVIAFDFDGTVAIGAFPDIGTAVPNWPVIEWLRKRSLKGDRLLLWTCRENYGGCRYPDAPYLDDAVKFCSRVGLHVDNVNMSVGETEGDLGTRYGRKVTNMRSQAPALQGVGSSLRTSTWTTRRCRSTHFRDFPGCGGECT